MFWIGFARYFFFYTSNNFVVFIVVVEFLHYAAVIGQITKSIFNRVNVWWISIACNLNTISHAP